jgi:hypothetical protein
MLRLIFMAENSRWDAAVRFLPRAAHFGAGIVALRAPHCDADVGRHIEADQNLGMKLTLLKSKPTL